MLVTPTVSKTLLVSTSTPLTASATFTSTGIDTMPANGTHMGRVTGRVMANQSGNFFMDVSDDGVTWDQIYTIAVAAGGIQPIDQTTHCKYVRFRYTNGATAQGVFRLSIYGRAQ